MKTAEAVTGSDGNISLGFEFTIGTSGHGATQCELIDCPFFEIKGKTSIGDLNTESKLEFRLQQLAIDCGVRIEDIVSISSDKKPQRNKKRTASKFLRLDFLINDEPVQILTGRSLTRYAAMVNGRQVYFRSFEALKKAIKTGKKK